MGNVADTRQTQGAFPGTESKLNTPISAKAVLLGASEEGKAIVGIIVQNESSHAIWLPRVFEAVNVTIHRVDTLQHLHMDFGSCSFPRDYSKLVSGAYHVYEIELPWSRLEPFAHKVEIWAPARQKSVDDAKAVIVERISAVLDPKTLLAILTSAEPAKTKR